MIICHACQEVQWDRWAYRNHLLHAHGEVIRGGTNTPVRLEGRELERVWTDDYRRLLSASRRREALGLPRVPDQEVARRLHEDRARRARRGRAAGRATEATRQRTARLRAARPARAPAHVTPPPTVTPPTVTPPTYVAPPMIDPSKATTERHTIFAGRQPATVRPLFELSLPAAEKLFGRAGRLLVASPSLTPYLSPSRHTSSTDSSHSFTRTPPAVA